MNDYAPSILARIIFKFAIVLSQPHSYKMNLHATKYKSLVNLNVIMVSVWTRNCKKSIVKYIFCANELYVYNFIVI